jgi:arylsulfatase A-like enzyme
MDRDFAVLAEGLRERGRLDRTVLVVLADHGESLDDHGELLHGDAYYDGVAHIPMLVKVPGRPGSPHPALVSQVDLLPTLLELVGAVPPAGIDGASMVPLYDGRATAIRSTTLVEGGVSWHDDAHARGAVISPPWAMLRQDRGCGEDAGPQRAPGEPATCLYALDKDPGQLENVAGGHADVIADLSGRWDKFRAARGAGRTLALDPAYVEELRRTGYDFTVVP